MKLPDKRTHPFRDPLPALFSDRRTDYRKEYNEGAKEGDAEKIEEALCKLYSLGLLYVYCYGSGNGEKGVIGYQYDKAIEGIHKTKHLKDKLSCFSYQEDGKILGCNFISERDWKRFEKLWGNNGKTLDIRSIFQKFPGLPLFSDSRSLPSDTL